LKYLKRWCFGTKVCTLEWR